MFFLPSISPTHATQSDPDQQKVEKADLQKKCKEPSFRVTWCQDCFYPFLQNEADRLRGAKAADIPHWDVTLGKSYGQSARMIKADFWPLAIYEAHHEEPPHSDAVVDYVFQRKTYRGVWKDPDGKPLPSGVIMVNDFDETAVKHNQTLETSDCNYDMDPLASTQKTMEAWGARLSKPFDPTVASTDPVEKRKTGTPTKEKEPDEPAAKRAMKGGKKMLKKQDSQCSESSVDFASALGFASFSSKGTAQASPQAKGKVKKVVLKRTVNHSSPQPSGNTKSPAKVAKGKGKKSTGSPGNAQAAAAAADASDNWRSRAARKRKGDSIQAKLAAAASMVSQFQDDDQCRTLKVANVEAAQKNLGQLQDIDGPTMSCFKIDLGLLSEEGQELMSQMSEAENKCERIASVLRFATAQVLEEPDVQDFSDCLCDLEKPGSEIKPSWFIQQACILAMAGQKLKTELASEQRDYGKWSEMIMLHVMPTETCKRRISSMAGSAEVKHETQEAILYDGINLLTASVEEPEDILACFEDIKKAVAAATIRKAELRIDAQGDLKKIEEVLQVGRLLDQTAGIAYTEESLCSARASLKGTGKLIRCFASCRPYFVVKEISTSIFRCVTKSSDDM